MRGLFLLSACTALAAPGVKWGNIPLSFEPNTGQATQDVRYLARGSAYALYLTARETVLAGQNQAPLRTTLVGANPSARIVGEDQQTSTSNYFVGNDPSKWRTSVPNYGKVHYTGLYPGIDLVYYGHDGNLEYDWIVSPGADPQKIRLIFDGADRLRIDKQGDLVIKLGNSEYRHRKPVVYQEVAGRRVQVAGGWNLHGKEGSFRVGAYDHARPLVIDPVLIFSTYHGGTGLDYAYAVAVDQAGSTYVTGTAGSTNFPTTKPYQGSLHGATDAFVTKINANGSARVYSTYLGGGGPDSASGITVDTQGNVYVTGNAGSFDFPMQGAIQGTWGGSGDAFLTKINAAGSALVYSTYLGGASSDYATAVAIDPAGYAYIVGVTFSTNFPTVSPYQSVKGAQQDAFVAKINPAGTAWVYATYLGGNAVDEGYAIAADAAGNAYVTGYTGSSNFPMASPYRNSNASSVDAFVTKLNPAGSALVYSTYLGGSSTDYGTAIAVDSSGSAYVTGIVDSNDFPIVNAMQPTFGGGDDAFVTKFTPAGTALVYSTYLGGGSVDDPYALAIDQAGNAYVTGRTNSSDFPLTGAIQSTRFAFDMFVTKLNASGSARLFSTYIGGTGGESGRGIAVDRVGNIHIAGETTSTDFPMMNAIQSTNGGGAVTQDAVVLLLGDTQPVNGNTRVAIFRAGTWVLNVNGTGFFGPPDEAFGWGASGSKPIVGDWSGNGQTKAGVFQSGAFYLDVDGNGSWTSGVDRAFVFGTPSASAIPVVGDWNGDGKTKVGYYDQGTWYLDYNNDGVLDAGDKTISWGAGMPSAIPVVGDWNGTGTSKVGVYNQGVWYLDNDGSGTLTAGDQIFPWGTGMPAAIPVVGDWNGNGKTKAGVFNNGTWYLDTDGSGSFTAGDKVFAWGSTGWTPVVGDWNGNGKTKIGVFFQGNWYLDVNGSTIFDAGDLAFGWGISTDTPVTGKW